MKTSTANWNSYPLVEETRPSKWHQRRVVFSRPYWKELPLERTGKLSRETAHAPTKYQSNSTSGRGARASYQTMLPEISARRSLLEPSFRYLSPGREGEKCRPLDHLGHIPFVNSARQLMGSNFLYIPQHYSYFLHVVRSSVLRWCIFNHGACVLAETLLFMVPNH